MSKTIHAIYENGVLKPTRKLPFEEAQEVVLKVVSAKQPPERPTRRPRPALALIGIFEGPRNLSRDPDRHLYGQKKKAT